MRSAWSNLTMAAGSRIGIPKLVAAVQCMALLTLHLRAEAFSNPLRSARIMYSGSGITLPQIPKFDCDTNKTLYMEDFLRLPHKDKIFLTRDGSGALAFLAERNALLIDGEGDKDDKRLKFESCAVVGNGGVLKLSEHGPAIDSHDVVFRSNQAPTSSYERHTGVKTSFRVVNKHWLIKYSTGGPKWIPKEKGMVLVMGRGEDDLMEKTFDFYSDSSDFYTVKMGGQVGSRARALLVEFRNRVKCLKGNRFHGGTTPTSGLYQVLMALSLCKAVTVYGFGDGGKQNYQYYTFYNTERKFGNTEVHSFDAEKALMDQLDREKILVFCNAKKDQKTCGCQNERGCPSSSKLYGPGRRSSDEAQEDTGVRIVSGGWAVQEDDGTEAGAVGKGASAGSFQAAAGSAASAEAVERMLAPAAEKRVTLTQEDLDEILGVVGSDILEGVPLQSTL